MAVLLGLMVVPSLSAGPRSIIIDDFEHGLAEHWDTKQFKGMTEYAVVRDDGNSVLRAESNASASGLVYRYEYDPKEYPVLSWRWRVENIIAKGDERSREGDDYAARVYVIFPHWLPPLTRTINYIWANKLPQGSHLPNAYYDRAVMVAVESGGAFVGVWREEARNVVEDYRLLFGGDPPRVGAIAIMTDTDNTGESAVAYYDDIVIGKH